MNSERALSTLAKTEISQGEYQTATQLRLYRAGVESFIAGMRAGDFELARVALDAFDQAGQELRKGHTPMTSPGLELDDLHQQNIQDLRLAFEEIYGK